MRPHRGVGHGMDMRDALRAWAAAGGSVEPVYRTGEIRLRHPAIPLPLRLNGRRKDTPRCLTSALRKIVR